MPHINKNEFGDSQKSVSAHLHTCLTVVAMIWVSRVEIIMHFPVNLSPIDFIAHIICKASSYKFNPNKHAKTGFWVAEGVLKRYLV